MMPTPARSSSERPVLITCVSRERGECGKEDKMGERERERKEEGTREDKRREEKTEKKTQARKFL